MMSEIYKNRNVCTIILDIRLHEEILLNLLL